ncbi:MAG: NADPH:quinone oxidoreductase family protein [Pseudomonadota bacterium]
MRAIVCPDYGPPESLRVEERPDPVPGPGQALVRHWAWGVNFVDILMCAGGYQLKPEVPFIPGGEAAGEVVDVGDGAPFRVGDKVMTARRLGMFAELAVADAGSALAMPAAFDFAEGAAFRSVYMTAWNALTHGARLEAGDKVLVLGAAGGVGLAAVQIAKLKGAEVIAGASSAAKRAALASHADFVIDQSSGFRDEVKDLSGGGVDVVVDPVGGEIGEEALRAMAYGCRYLRLGFTAGRPPAIRSNHLLIKGASAIGFRAGEIGRRNPGLNEQTMSDLLALAEAGRLRPHISHRADWPKITAAMRPITNREVIGKSVMVDDG